MIRHRTLGFVREGNATVIAAQKRPEDPARAAAISSWDAMLERLKETESRDDYGGPATGPTRPGTWDQIQAWLEKNKTVVYVSAIGLIGLAVLRRR